MSADLEIPSSMQILIVFVQEKSQDCLAKIPNFQVDPKSQHRGIKSQGVETVTEIRYLINIR